MNDLTFTVIGTSDSATKFIAKTKNFTLIIDEPTQLGGNNEGANPVEYILAGFAGCLNVVGHQVAKELGFTISKLEIEAKGSLDPNRFLGISNIERAGFKKIHLNLIPETNATIETLAKWLKIVEDRCPVRDNLKNKTPIKVSVEKHYKETK